jgi:hypothetical protein
MITSICGQNVRSSKEPGISKRNAVMRKPKPIRERAARALCDLHGLAADTKMAGAPMWQSYLPEVDAVLQAVVSKESWESVSDASEGKELKIVD